MINQKNMVLKLTSPAFENNGNIPSQYTCDGINVNPPLIIEGVPENTVTLALIVDDPDAAGGDWVHWILWNIPPDTTEILENSMPLQAQTGVNDFKETGYGGPCPPTGKHQYSFKLFALSIPLVFENETVTKSDIDLEMQGHIIEMATLNGYYSRS